MGQEENENAAVHSGLDEPVYADRDAGDGKGDNNEADNSKEHNLTSVGGSPADEESNKDVRAKQASVKERTNRQTRQKSDTEKTRDLTTTTATTTTRHAREAEQLKQAQVES